MKFILKQKKRSAVSPVIATLLLIAIAVAAAIIVYAFVTGLIGGLTTSSNGLVVISGSLTVPGGSGIGSLVVTVKNSASNPIQSVNIGTDAGDVGVVVGYSPQNNVAWVGSSAGSAGGPSVPVFAGSLPIGQTVSAIGTTTSAVAGTTYTFTVSVLFTGSTSPTIQTFSVTAQV